jgi:hypothetical protein
MMGQSETLSISSITHLLHCFLQVHNAAAPFTSHGNACNYAEPKPFSGAKPADFGFSSSNFHSAGSHTEYR